MKTGFKVFLAMLALLLVSLIFAIIGFANKWFDRGVEIVSPQNVEKQHEQIIGKYESAIASARNICQIQGKVSEGTNRSATLVEGVDTAYIATFNNIVQDYNSSMDNLFKAKIVAPNGYPKSVQLHNLDLSDWCTVDDQLLELKR